LECQQDNGIWRQALECRPEQEQNNSDKLIVFYFLVLCRVPNLQIRYDDLVVFSLSGGTHFRIHIYTFVKGIYEILFEDTESV
jgi:hypothetical protein